MNRPSEFHASSAVDNRRIAAMIPDPKNIAGHGASWLSFAGLRHNPFNVNPDPRHLFWTPQAVRALSELKTAVESGKSLIVLTGEVGTGKTTLINHLLNSLRERNLPVAFVFNSHLDVDNLYDFILADFGIQEDLSRPRNVRKTLHDWLYARQRAGFRPILIIDEAQGLTFHVLEEVRMLLNLETEGEKLIQIVLSGQPELDATLAKPQLLQLRQRISLRCRTAPLTIAETHDYIHRRLQFGGAQPDGVFAHEALDAIYFYSGGTPRVVNLLCEQALQSAHGQKALPVSTKIVEEVAREFQFDDFKPFPRSLDFSPTTIADVLPMPSSPTKMRMAAMAAREATPVEIPPAQALNPLPAPAPCTDAPPTPAAVKSIAVQVQPQNAVSAPAATTLPLHSHEPVPMVTKLPISARVGVALRPALQTVRRTISASSRWLREPMRSS